MRPLLFLFLGCAGTAFAQTTEAPVGQGSLALVDRAVIDLPTVLKLAGADNLEVRLAEEKLREAQAREDGTLWQLFPTLAPGVAYRGHTGRTQAVTGQVLDVDKASLAAGATVQLQLELGEAVYRRLAARQVASAADHGLAAQRRRSVLDASLAYYELLRAHLAVELLADAARVAREYHGQVARGVAAGIAAKGDGLRAFAQANRAEVRLRQAEEARGRASTRLAELLRLRIDGPLQPAEREAALLPCAEQGLPLDQLLQRAMTRRPELAESEALTAAAGREAEAARYAPLYPTLGAQYFAGGLGGSAGSARRDYASSADTSVTLTWKIGAGGLLDDSRLETAEARERQARLRGARLRESIARQVVDARAEVAALDAQLALLAEGVAAGEAGLRLTLARKEFAVGAVLETVQAQQDAIQAKLDYLATLTEANQARQRLRAAIGD